VGYTHAPRKRVLLKGSPSKYIVNIGSVGWPCYDGRPAGFVVYQPDKSLVKFETIDTNKGEVLSTMSRMKRMGLPEEHVSRISKAYSI